MLYELECRSDFCDGTMPVEELCANFVKVLGSNSRSREFIHLVKIMEENKAFIRHASSSLGYDGFRIPFSYFREDKSLVTMWDSYWCEATGSYIKKGAVVSYYEDRGGGVITRYGVLEWLIGLQRKAYAVLLKVSAHHVHSHFTMDEAERVAHIVQSPAGSEADIMKVYFTSLKAMNRNMTASYIFMDITAAVSGKDDTLTSIVVQPDFSQSSEQTQYFFMPFVIT